MIYARQLLSLVAFFLSTSERVIFISLNRNNRRQANYVGDLSDDSVSLNPLDSLSTSTCVEGSHTGWRPASLYKWPSSVPGCLCSHLLAQNRSIAARLFARSTCGGATAADAAQTAHLGQRRTASVVSHTCFTGHLFGRRRARPALTWLPPTRKSGFTFCYSSSSSSSRCRSTC